MNTGLNLAVLSVYFKQASSCLVGLVCRGQSADDCFDVQDLCSSFGKKLFVVTLY